VAVRDLQKGGSVRLLKRLRRWWKRLWVKRYDPRVEFFEDEDMGMLRANDDEEVR
jgi:hypothetical protein